MKLTDVLLRWKKALPRGHLWRGKYRLYKTVTKSDTSRMKLNFQLEEQNMFYLRHPYLTSEQSYGHTKALNMQEIRRKKLINEQAWKEHKYMGDRFGFLKVSDKWEE